MSRTVEKARATTDHGRRRRIREVKAQHHVPMSEAIRLKGAWELSEKQAETPKYAEFCHRMVVHYASQITGIWVSGDVDKGT